MTWSLNGVALVKEFKYRSAKVKLTGSASSMEIMFSFSSEAFWRHMMFASPMSPAVENLTPSLVTLMDTVSPMVAKSLQMRWNSTDGILMVTAYSVSGIPKCSLSMSMSFNSKSEIFSWPASFRLRQSFARASSLASRRRHNRAHRVTHPETQT